jgi:hypothetical protein
LKIKTGTSLDLAVDELKEIEKEKRDEASLYTHARRILSSDIAGPQESDLWLDRLPSEVERNSGWVPHPNLLRSWQSRLHEIPIVGETIKKAGRKLVAFGPWTCQCGRVLAALGDYSSGPVFMGGSSLECLCGRDHSIPAPLYKAFVYVDGWHVLQSFP